MFGMGSIMGITIVFIVIAVPLIIIAGAILLGIKIISGGSSSKDPKAKADETKIIQEIYQGLNRMEERVEALETILIERENGRKEKQ
ncbi:phage-shock protein [Deltaproteobacteria bacterium]|nr:phage-shock protein [Deltaproteobacteria bacterium]